MAPSRASNLCSNCLRNLIRQQRQDGFSTSRRNFASQTVTIDAQPEDSATIPRWQRTPPAMKMPFRLRPEPKGPAWIVNDRLAPLDEMYDRMFVEIRTHEGQTLRGRDVLDEETKWLAVTHRSFDHGRRGNNDRLAFLGKRIVDLQCSLALLNAPVPRKSTYFDPEDSSSTALKGIDNLTPFAKQSQLDKSRLAPLAQSYGLGKVMRWKPRKVTNLQSSGQDTVLAHCLYSIIGALSLQRGGEVAGRTVRDRILQPLG